MCVSFCRLLVEFGAHTREFHFFEHLKSTREFGAFSRDFALSLANSAPLLANAGIQLGETAKRQDPTKGSPVFFTGY